MNLSKFSMKKLLGMAARAEIDANKTYGKLAGRVNNPLLKEKFSLLAFEEKKHEKVIRNLFKSTYKPEAIEIPKAVDPALLPAVVIKPSSSLTDILYQAMTSELAAQNFYAGLAPRVKAEKKRMLEYLSKVEKSHYMMLKSEFVMALNFEDYAEKDIDKVVS
jgi:rubrerythrin